MKVIVLCSSYNGERFIREQLDSIINQTYRNIEVIVRDDGSVDNTVKILNQYKDKITFYTGENIGCVKSFWELLHIAPEADYYAFCDQDDVWDNDKIEIAIDCLKNNDQNISQLYFSDVRVVDENLNLISSNMIDFVPVDFKHSLIRNISPGCTFVFNNVARCQLLKYPVELIGKDMHDWCVYRICSYVGDIFFDRNTHMMYRQHDNNVLGAKNTFVYLLKQALKRLISGYSNRQRSSFAKTLLQIYNTDICSEKMEVCKNFAYYKTEYKRKCKLFFKTRYSIGFLRGLYFRLLIVMNKV